MTNLVYFLIGLLSVLTFAVMLLPFSNNNKSLTSEPFVENIVYFRGANRIPGIGGYVDKPI
jgi:hypothetical protein